MKKSILVKLGGAAAALAIVAVLFVRSLEDTTSAAYTVPRPHLGGWQAALEPASRPNDPLIVLRSTPELVSGLFRQVFSRAMESLASPAAGSIAVVLKGEFDRVIADQFTPEAVLAAAKQAGLESSAIAPRCMVHRRVSEPGGTRQVYFVAFDAPAVVRFRQQLGLDADALTPVLFIAAASPDFSSWLPQRVNVQTDCLAPVEVGDR